MKRTFRSLAALLLVLSAAPCGAEETEVTFRVTGLFMPSREDDLKEFAKQIPEVTLISVDFKLAEAKFKFDAAKAFPGAKPDKYAERLDNLLRNATRHTMGIRPQSTTPRDKLEFVEIGVVGLDCKACSLACYECVYKLDGVEQATASFKDGLVTAWIDPTKTDKGKLEAALKQRNVQLKTPPAAEPAK